MDKNSSKVPSRGEMRFPSNNLFSGPVIVGVTVKYLGRSFWLPSSNRKLPNVRVFEAMANEN